METGPIVDAIAAAGLRVTGARRTVAALVAAQDGHFTAADLVADAAARRLRVGRATIFRTLDALVAIGAVERVDLPSGEHAYVVCRPDDHHHHVICASCGRTREIVDGRLAEILADVERLTGYRIDGHRIELYGTCPICRRRARRGARPAAVGGGGEPGEDG
ncbi:MAG TPA: Fur family transcriptional regulator [Candidatus Binatia bacterium]|nr:Fur family transcriptional regulator [Candidatus Binatia bacterium]